MWDRKVAPLQDIDDHEKMQQALRRSVERLRVLHELDQAILASQSVDEIAEAALRQIPHLMPCLRADVILFDLTKDEMSLLAVYASGETELTKGWHGLLEGTWHWVINELVQGRTYVIADLQDVPPAMPMIAALRTEGVRAQIYAPLSAQENLIGALSLGLAIPGPLEPELMEIAEELADQLAVAIQQARLLEDVQHYADALEKTVARRTAALRISEARFRVIFEDAALGIALLDQQGRVMQSNPALQRMLAVEGADLNSASLRRYIHVEDSVTYLDAFAALMRGKRTVDKLHVRLVPQDRQTIWVKVTLSMVQGSAVRPRLSIAMIEDVTEQHQAQMALMQAEKLALTGRLAASLAHEINNPLQTVIGCLGLAQELFDVDEEISGYLQMASEELKRAAGIVARLRDLNRPTKPEEREATDVVQLLEHVLALTDQQCRDRDIDVSLNAQEDLPLVRVVPDRIQQVFLNLVLNAMDAMPEGGKLTLNIAQTRDPPGMRIAFTDEGVGILPGDLPNLFAPFYTTKPEGIGLGLFISQNIVENHGGHIEVESQKGHGTTFTLWLPEG